MERGRRVAFCRKVGFVFGAGLADLGFECGTHTTVKGSACGD